MIYGNRGDFDKSADAVRKARDLAMQSGELTSIAVTFANLVRSYTAQGDDEKARTMAQELLEITQKPGFSFPTDANSASWAHIVLGVYLAQNLFESSDVVASSLYAQVYAHFEEALKLSPTTPDRQCVLRNWASVLISQAAGQPDEIADGLLAQACAKYNAAMEIKPNDHEILYDCAKILAERGSINNGEKADQLYADAFGKFDASLKTKPDDPDILLSYACALSNHATTKVGAQAETFFAQAATQCYAALKIDPMMGDALYVLALILMKQAMGKPDDLAHKLLEEAREKLLLAERVAPGTATYDVACVHVRLGQETEARTLLEQLRDGGILPTKEELLADPNLLSIQQLPWFRSLLQSPLSPT
jgi:tetratricopeptide (TPR) repeat protein